MLIEFYFALEILALICIGLSFYTKNAFGSLGAFVLFATLSFSSYDIQYHATVANNIYTNYTVSSESSYITYSTQYFNYSSTVLFWLNFLMTIGSLIYLIIDAAEFIKKEMR